MAEENILNISLKEYKKQIDDLKGSLLGLEQQSDEYKSKLSQVQSMQGKLNSVLSDCKNTNSAVQGSYNALVAELASLRTEWKSTADQVERAQLGEKMLAVNNQLKALDASVGNYQRNVGDYANQFQSAFSSLGGSIEGTFNSLQTLVQTVPKLGEAFSSAGKSITALFNANPYLLAIAVALTAIVTVAEKFKSAVSKNAELQKKWTANMAAFQPVIEMLNKAVDWFAQIIMDCVDWCVDHIPTAVKAIIVVVDNLIDYWKLLINAVLFFPKTVSKAMAMAVKLVGAGAEKMGSALSGVASFFGFDEAAQKIKTTMSSISQTVSNFGDGMAKTIETSMNAVNSFFDTGKEKVNSFLSSLGEQMVASKKNIKAQQQLAKEGVALEKKAYEVSKQITEKRIAMKKAETKEEKERLRQEAIALNEQLAKEKKAFAEKKLLLKEEQYTRNGRILSKNEKAELTELRIAAARAGSEELQRNVELTAENSTSTVSKSMTHAAKKAATTFTKTFLETFKSLMASIKDTSFSDIFEKKIETLTTGSRIRETAAKNIQSYLTIDDGTIKRTLEGTSERVEQQIRLFIGDILNKNGDFVEQSYIDKVFEATLGKAKYGEGSYDISKFKDNLIDYLRNTLNYSKDDIEKEVMSEWDGLYSYIGSLISNYNSALPNMFKKRVDSIDFSTTDLKRLVNDYEEQLSAARGALEKANEDFDKAVEAEDADAVNSSRSVVQYYQRQTEDLELLLKAAKQSLSTTTDTQQQLSAVKRNIEAIVSAAKEVNSALSQVKQGDFKGVYEELTKFGQISITKDVKSANGQTQKAVKQWEELTQDELEAVKKVFAEKGYNFLVNYYAALIKSIGDNASAIDKAIKDNISSNLATIAETTSATLKQAENGIERELQISMSDAFDGTILDDNWWESTNNKIKEYQDAMEEAESTSQFSSLEAKLEAYNQEIDALNALKQQMIEVGATRMEMEEINQRIAETEANRTETLSAQHTFMINKVLKEEQKAAQKRQTIVNSVTKAMSNIGSSISTLTSIRQDSISSQLENGKITEEEANKQWETTKKFAKAAATISALGALVGEAYSIWTDSSITSYWAKAALIATAVPATAATLWSQISQINSTSPGSSSTSTPSSASVSSVAVTPILDENQDINTIQQIKAGNTSEAIKDQKVYILEQDIQKSNKKVSIREKNTRF